MEALGQVEVRVLHSPGLRLRNCLGPSPLGSGRSWWVLAGARPWFPSLSHSEPGQQSQALRPL